MDYAIAGLDVVYLMSREGSPGSYSESKACACPVIDANGAIAQVCDCTLHCLGYRRILERGRMNEDGGIECPPELFIGEGHSTVDIIGDIGCLKSGLGKEGAESFCGEADICFAVRINTCNQ